VSRIVCVSPLESAIRAKGLICVENFCIRAYVVNRGKDAMTETSRIDAVLARFDSALLKFEVESARKANDFQRLAALAEEAQALQSERQRMTRDLELLKSKAAELVSTTRLAAGKIDQAMSRIRAVLHSNSGA
jgi:1,6-anhydro-N-acetylmuramate kinase